MKCSSQRNCSTAWVRLRSPTTGLNEVQFPEELQQETGERDHNPVNASMKCSSRRNCSAPPGLDGSSTTRASMKCSSRRNCSPASSVETPSLSATPQ